MHRKNTFATKNVCFQKGENMEKDTKQKKKQKAASIISNILFYLMLGVMILTAFLYGSENGNGKNILGFSFANVLTTSMQSEIPKGSVVITRATEPHLLTIGDDITFLTETNHSYTHRIIDVYENYEDSGMRGFVTKGIENPLPDKEVVFDGNVIGKVILTIPNLGTFLNYIKENVFLVVGLFIVIMLLSFSLKSFFVKKDKSELTDETKTTKQINKT